MAGGVFCSFFESALFVSVEHQTLREPLSHDINLFAGVHVVTFRENNHLEKPFWNFDEGLCTTIWTIDHSLVYY